MFSEIRNILDGYIDRFGIPGNDMAIYHKGECVFREQRGYSDYDGTKKMNGSELFNIYSCSKIITCTAAMKLFEAGEFKLDDPLYLYLPEFKEMSVRYGDEIRKAAEPIRIRGYRKGKFRPRRRNLYFVNGYARRTYVCVDSYGKWTV